MDGLIPPLAFVAIVVSIIGLIVYVGRNYIKCPPNMVLVIYGRKHTTIEDGQPVTKGFRLITGGAAFRLPLLEQVSTLPLNMFQVALEIDDAPNQDGVLISVNAVANMKISSDPILLSAAVERFLDVDQNEIHQIIRDTLEGHLRQIIGTLTIEQIVRDRESISQNLLTIAGDDLRIIGLECDNFVVTSVADKQGYIEALGKKRTAEVKRDAAIGEAEADREATIKTSDARREGEQRRLAAEQSIAEANRDLDLKKAGIKTQVETAQAQAELAKEMRETEIRKELIARKVAVEQSEVESQTVVADKRAALKERELVTEVIRPAEAERDAASIRAEGLRKAAIIEAEAERTTAVTRAEGAAKARTTSAEAEASATTRIAEATKIKLSAEGEGQALAQASLKREQGMAEAQVIQAKLEAEATGIRAKLLAEAEGERQKLLAEAEGKKAALLAEAEGFARKNEALAKMTAETRAIITLELMPRIIEELGESGERIGRAMFEPIGQGVSKIDSVQIVDMGGGGNGSSPIERFATATPGVIFQTMQGAKALGIDFSGLFDKVGIKLGPDAAGSAATGGNGDETLPARR